MLSLKVPSRTAAEVPFVMWNYVNRTSGSLTSDMSPLQEDAQTQLGPCICWFLALMLVLSWSIAFAFYTHLFAYNYVTII